MTQGTTWSLRSWEEVLCRNCFCSLNHFDLCFKVVIEELTLKCLRISREVEEVSYTTLKYGYSEILMGLVMHLQSLSVAEWWKCQPCWSGRFEIQSVGHSTSGKGRHTGCQVFCMILVQHIYSGRVFPWCRMAFIAWNSWNSVMKIILPMPGVGVIENQLCLWVFESPSSEPEWSLGSSTSHSPGEWESCSKHFMDFLTFVCMEHNYSTH